MEDNDIISSCLSGERETFEMLVKKYQAPLLHLAWRILGNKDEAKDATQDAFVQTFSNLDRFDRTKSFKNWIEDSEVFFPALKKLRSSINHKYIT